MSDDWSVDVDPIRDIQNAIEEIRNNAGLKPHTTVPGAKQWCPACGGSGNLGGETKDKIHACGCIGWKEFERVKKERGL